MIEYCVNKIWISFEIHLKLRHDCVSVATSVNTDHSYRVRRKGTFVEVALFRNSTAFNTCKCSLGTKFPCPVSQVQEGDAEEERRKACCHYCAEMSCSPPTPPHPTPPSACIVMNRLVSRKHLGQRKVCELALCCVHSLQSLHEGCPTNTILLDETIRNGIALHYLVSLNAL